MMTFLSIGGALLVLIAFVASNVGAMSSKSIIYALLNCLGTGLLAITVIDPLNIGVLVVETVWSLFSAYLIVRALRERRRPSLGAGA